MRTLHFSALIEREDDGFVALAPELDIASQGDTVEEARLMLKEAVELFLAAADEEEIQRRMSGECYIVPMECSIA
jgi:predicted RNase H-like HicB family nuclease